MLGIAVKFVKLQYYRFTLMTGIYTLDRMETGVIYSFLFLCLLTLIYFQMP